MSVPHKWVDEELLVLQQDTPCGSSIGYVVFKVQDVTMANNTL